MSTRHPGPSNDLLAFDPVRREPDEPTLGEIWSMVAARWRLVIGIALAVTAVSAIGAYLYQPRYLFSSSVEIGIVTDNGRLIDPPETIVAKLQETYIPEARSAHVKAGEPDGPVPDIQVRIPRGSQLIVLESRGFADDAPLHEALHQEVVQRLQEDHRRSQIARRQALEAERAAAQFRLEGAADQLVSLGATLKALDVTEQLLARQAKALRAALADAVRSRDRVAQDSGDNSRALSLLVFDQEILRAEERLAAIDERLSVTIDAERRSNAKATGDTKRDQDMAAQTIGRVQAELGSLRDTRPLSATRRSGDPVGPDRLTIAALGSAGGLLLGVMAAIIAGLQGRRRPEHRGVPRP